MSIRQIEIRYAGVRICLPRVFSSRCFAWVSSRVRAPRWTSSKAPHRATASVSMDSGASSSIPTNRDISTIATSRRPMAGSAPIRNRNPRATWWNTISIPPTACRFPAIGTHSAPTSCSTKARSGTSANSIAPRLPDTASSSGSARPTIAPWSSSTASRWASTRAASRPSSSKSPPTFTTRATSSWSR